MYKIVEKPTKEVMQGDTELEKELNAFLTVFYILSKNVPDDECLSEARHIIKELTKDGMLERDILKAYLLRQFGAFSSKDSHEKAVHEILAIIKKAKENEIS